MGVLSSHSQEDGQGIIHRFRWSGTLAPGHEAVHCGLRLELHALRVPAVQQRQGGFQDPKSPLPTVCWALNVFRCGRHVRVRWKDDFRLHLEKKFSTDYRSHLWILQLVTESVKRAKLIIWPAH